MQLREKAEQSRVWNAEVVVCSVSSSDSRRRECWLLLLLYRGVTRGRRKPACVTATTIKPWRPLCFFQPLGASCCSVAALCASQWPPTLGQGWQQQPWCFATVRAEREISGAVWYLIPTDFCISTLSVIGLYIFPRCSATGTQPVVLTAASGAAASCSSLSSLAAQPCQWALPVPVAPAASTMPWWRGMGPRKRRFNCIL